jgi:hypothetical protein
MEELVVLGSGPLLAARGSTWMQAAARTRRGKGNKVDEEGQ